MKHPRLILAGLFAGLCTVTFAAVHMEKGGTDDFGPYKPAAADWLKPLVAGFIDRGCSVFVESPNRIWYTTDVEFPVPKVGPGLGGAGQRGPGPVPPDEHKPHIMILDAQGHIVENWGTQWESVLNMPHAVKINPYDPQRNVWIIDRDNDQIFEFTHDGKRLLLTMGEKGVQASDDTHFGRPADISFAPDGSYYVADGYANTRVIKFNKDNQRVLTWGTEGTGAGQFKVEVHDVAVDAQGRVLVADRGNNRIQIFDSNGKYLDEWDHITGVSYIWITKDGYVWAVSGRGNRLAKYDMNGKLLTYWGERGLGDGQFDDPHDFSVDAAGNLYVTSWSLNRVGLNKYTPVPGADRSRVIGLGLNRSLPVKASPRESPLSMTH